MRCGQQDAQTDRSYTHRLLRKCFCMTQTLNRPTIDIDSEARRCIQKLLQGEMSIGTERLDNYGPWEDTISSLENLYLKVDKKRGDLARAMQDAIGLRCKVDKQLAELLTPKIEVIKSEEVEYLQLPDQIKAYQSLAHLACPWLDEYIAISKKWSPRGHERFHEPIGIALLSTVAARRVAFPFGPQNQYTNMYIALLGDSTFYRKSTTTRVYENLLGAAKLDWLFGADITTPQKLLSDMAGQHVPSNYSKMDPEMQETTKKRLAMSGQLGWYYDEFGMHMDAMVRENGIMADFKGLLRRLDDSKPKFDSATISRGKERIEKPYLSLLASMTPSDIQPYAQKDNKFWKDGFFGRFCFVSPPLDAKYSRARPPQQAIAYPASLVEPLKAWNKELGMAEIDIIAETNKAGTDVTGYSIQRIKDLPEQICQADETIYEALFAYEGALLDIIEAKKIPDALKTNYGRLHILALRVAMLLASFTNHGKIELRHWARAQQFAEDRRRDLHELFAQVNTEREESTLEGAIIAFMKDRDEDGVKYFTTRDMQRGPSQLRKSGDELKRALTSLARAGEIEIAQEQNRQNKQIIDKYRLIVK